MCLPGTFETLGAFRYGRKLVAEAAKAFGMD
jgi:hypothetical protein